MVGDHRTGRKPKRLYARVARFSGSGPSEMPGAAAVRAFVVGFDRSGRLVAHGELTHPPGDLLVFRADDRDHAERLLRTDPFRAAAGATYDLLEWKAGELGAGINLEPPPELGSGRLTLLRRVTVIVRDQAEAIAWYRDVLGLTVIAQDAETQFVELALGKGTAAISLVEPRAEWGEPYYSETVARMGTPTGISFETDSVVAFELRLRHAGVRITAPPELQPWGERTLRFTDPYGNEFLAYEREGLKPPRPPGRPRSNPRPDGE
jgi:catechol 2,3-dioxygenase-like lactoylglutathione lyase family enzyme